MPSPRRWRAGFTSSKQGGSRHRSSWVRAGTTQFAATACSCTWRIPSPSSRPCAAWPGPVGLCRSLPRTRGPSRCALALEGDWQAELVAFDTRRQGQPARPRHACRQVSGRSPGTACASSPRGGAPIAHTRWLTIAALAISSWTMSLERSRGAKCALVLGALDERELRLVDARNRAASYAARAGLQVLPADSLQDLPHRPAARCLGLERPDPMPLFLREAVEHIEGP